MANENQAQLKWKKAPGYDKLTDAIDQMRQAKPAPISIKISIGAKDISHDAIEAFLALAQEHDVELTMTLTGTYGEGQQLTFWQTRGRPAGAPV